MPSKHHVAEMVLVTPLRRTLDHLLPNPNALVVVSKGTRAAKLCSIKSSNIDWGCWLTQVILYNGRKKSSADCLPDVSFLEF